jgi:RNA polymerase sigma-70 factor (ECF subfamily)
MNDAEQQFQQLYQSSYGFVRNKAFRLLRDEDEARDVAQETFCRAWRRWREVRSCASPLGWLLVAATHLCIDRLRHRQVIRAEHHRLQVERSDPSPGQGQPSTTSVLEMLRREGRMTQLAVVHVLIDEMTQEEAASVLGVSRKTIQRHIERFRKTMQARLSEKPGDHHA